MGEEEMKAAEEKMSVDEKKEPPPAKGDDEKPPPEEVNEDEKKSEEAKDEPPADPAPASPPPPLEIILSVSMHCEGCARKVRRCLIGFQGVEEVIADCRGSKVTVKGEKADPLKVLERVRKKSHRKVELISPIPTPPVQQEEAVKAEDKIDQPPPVIIVVLGVYMHCDACAQEIKRRIHKMNGVKIVEPNQKGSQVKVKGIFEPQKLVDYVYKRTGKHATIIKVEPEKKEEEKTGETKDAKEEKENKEEKKAEEESGEKEAKIEEQAPAKENNEGSDDSGAAATGNDGSGEPAGEQEAEAEGQKLELIKNEFYYYYPQNYQLNYPRYPPRFVYEIDAYPPQIFSDENPNACSIM